MSRSVHAFIAVLLMLVPLPGLLAGWRQLLPLSGGSVDLVVTDAAGHLYAASGGGLRKSTDLGKTWIAAGGALPVASFSAVAAHPVTAGLIFVGTPAGVFRTSDGGNTWTPVNVGTGAPISVIAIAPSDGNYVYVATSGDYIYRSTDGGASWARQSQGLSNTPYPGFMTSLAVDPLNRNRVYTSTWRGRLYRSDDAGSSFAQISDAGTWANGQIYISRSDPRVLYTVHDETWFGRGTVLKSTDSGASWSDVGRPSGKSSGASSLAISPTNPDIVYAATDRGIAKTSTGGGRWDIVLTPAPVMSAAFAIAVNAKNTQQVFAGSSQYGFYVSADGGATWTPRNTGIMGAQVAAVSVCPSNTSIIYAAVQTRGFLKSLDGGRNWQPVGGNQPYQDMYASSIACSPVDPNSVVASVSDGTNGSMLSSADGGKTFSTFPGYGTGILRFHPRSSSTISASIGDWQGGFLRSTDKGLSWHVPDSQYIYPGDYTFHPTLANVVLSVGNEYTGDPLNRLYVLYSNTTGGSPWNRSGRFGQGSFRALCLDGSDPSTLYVAGRIASENSQGVFRFSIAYSGSGIVSVTRASNVTNNGLTDPYVTRLLCDKTGVLYASTPSAVFRLKKGAAAWENISLGVPFYAGDFIDLTPDGKRLLVGTGGGIWEYTDSGTPTPILVADPASLNFPATATNWENTATVKLRNAGTGPLTLMGIVPSPSTDYTNKGGCPPVLNTNASCTLTIGFRPTAVGFRPGSLQVSSDAANGVQTVALLGNGLPPAAPALRISKTTISFPHQPISTPSGHQGVTITNAGGSDLTLSNLTIVDPKNAQAFNTTGPNCPTVLKRGTECTMFVYFKPQRAGLFDAELVITSDAAGAPHKVQLSGLSLDDDDDDGLPNLWEANGVVIDDVFLDLPAMGANPKRKDIFVEIDWMRALDHNHEPKPNAIAKVIQAFASTPACGPGDTIGCVRNPDGSGGISLHVDCGPVCVMVPAFSSKPAVLWGAYSGSNSVPHFDPITGHPDEIGDYSDAFDWTSFDLIKAANFSSARSRVFRYMLMAHNQAIPTSDPGKYPSGISRTRPGSDSLITLAALSSDENAQAGTIMHELGHLLGLRHGGDDDVNYKPNYLSIMNYLFQLEGLIVDGLEGALGFSRAKFNTLNQSSLDESQGVLGIAGNKFYPPSTVFGTRYFCPPSKGPHAVIIADATKPIDWDCDQIPSEKNVSAHIDGSSVYRALDGGSDWEKVNLIGGAIGQLGAPLPPVPIRTEELTPEVAAKIVPVFGVSLHAPSEVRSTFSTTVEFQLSIMNTGSAADTYTLRLSSNQPWPVLPPEMTVPVQSGAQRLIRINISVPGGLAADQTLAEITASVTSQSNSRVSDSAKIRVHAGQANLAVSLHDSADPVAVGSPLTYTLVLRNLGPDPAHYSVAKLTFGTNPQIVSATTTNGSCSGTGPVNCSFGAVTAGSSVSATIVVTPSVGGTLNATAEVTSAGFDPVQANDVASETTVLVGRPALSARVLTQTRTGDLLTVDLAVTNGGTEMAKEVVFSQIAARTLSGTGAVAVAGPTLPTALGDIAAGTAKTLTLAFVVSPNVTRFSVTETATMKDTSGKSIPVTLAQAITP